MRGFLVALLCLALTVLPACGVLTPQQKASVRTTIESGYSDGTITRPQRDAAIEALDKDKPFDWSALGLIGVNIALALVGGPFVVRMQRGPPTQVVGLPESKIQKAPA